MSIYVETNHQSFWSWREAQNLVNGDNMYALGVPIPVHPTAPADPVGSQESDDMKYLAIKWCYSSPRPTWGYGTDVKGTS